MINELAEIWIEIMEMEKAYPVAFGAWTVMYMLFWSFVWVIGDFVVDKISLKRSLKRLNNKNGKAGKKE